MSVLDSRNMVRRLRSLGGSYREIRAVTGVPEGEIKRILREQVRIDAVRAEAMILAASIKAGHRKRRLRKPAQALAAQFDKVYAEARHEGLSALDAIRRASASL